MSKNATLKKPTSKILLQNLFKNPQMDDLKKAGIHLIMEKEIMNNRSGIISLIATTKYVYEKGSKKNTLTLKNRSNTEILLPENFHTIHKIVFKTVSIVHDYEKAMNNMLIKAGKNPDFKSSEHYAERFENSLLIFQHKVDKNLYFRVYPDLCKCFNHYVKYFDSNMEEINDDLIPQLKIDHLPLPPKKKPLIAVNQYHMKNIKYVKRGKFEVIDCSIDEVKKLITG